MRAPQRFETLRIGVAQDLHRTEDVGRRQHSGWAKSQIESDDRLTALWVECHVKEGLDVVVDGTEFPKYDDFEHGSR